VTARFTGEEHHQRRLAKAAALEQRYGAAIDFKEGERA
jgi:hypothetical protein